jgi:mannan endo-1,4-beta-mannosidase
MRSPGPRPAPRPLSLTIVVACAWVLLLGACGAQTYSPTDDGLPSAFDEHQDAHGAPPADGDDASGAEATPARLFGAFTYGGVWRGMEPVLALEEALGRRLDVVHWFTNWDNAYEPWMVEAVAADGRSPLISWQPHRQDVRDIAAGAYDDYVRGWARGVAAAPGLVYIRPFPEMNGDWVSWNGDPDGLRAAWRHIAGIFEREHAHNVRWVFGPNVTDEPRTEANALERYYPGDDIVDVLALSGYNWGTTREYIGWRSFEEIFEPAYARLTALGDQTVWLAEIASSEEGGDKAAWIRAMLDSTAFERVAAVIWFNEDKEADWRLESSYASLAAFRDWFVEVDAR